MSGTGEIESDRPGCSRTTDAGAPPESENAMSSAPVCVAGPLVGVGLVVDRPVSVEEESDPRISPKVAGPRPVRQARGIRRVLLVIGGLACVGMAYLGAILPGLPTTPWVLLAGECFRRSSPRLQRWLRRSPIFGRLIRDWEDHRGIRRPVKVFAVCMIVTVVSISILSGRLPVWVRWVVGGCAACGVCTIVFVVPTVRERRGGT